MIILPKSFMHKPESVLENEIHKVLWNLEIPTSHLILIRFCDDQQEHRKLSSSGFCHHRGQQRKNTRKRDRQMLEPCERTKTQGGARGVMVIVTGYRHGDTSSIPGQDWLHFHIALIPLGKVWIQLFSLQLWVK